MLLFYFPGTTSIVCLVAFYAKFHISAKTFQTFGLGRNGTGPDFFVPLESHKGIHRTVPFHWFTLSTIVGTLLIRPKVIPESIGKGGLTHTPGLARSDVSRPIESLAGWLYADIGDVRLPLVLFIQTHIKTDPGFHIPGPLQ